MPAGEMSCAASVTPRMRPVSCSGKKPFGMIRNSQTVDGDCGEHDHQRDEAMAQRHDQGTV